MKEIGFISRNLKSIQNVCLFPKNTLNENIKILKSAKLLISHDTYSIHLSSLLSIPTVGIYISTDPVIWGSYNNPHFTYISSAIKCKNEKNGCGNCIHFHTSCPDIEKMRNSIDENLVVSTIKNAIKKLNK